VTLQNPLACVVVGRGGQLGSSRSKKSGAALTVAGAGARRQSTRRLGGRSRDESDPGELHGFRAREITARRQPGARAGAKVAPEASSVGGCRESSSELWHQSFWGQSTPSATSNRTRPPKRQLDRPLAPPLPGSLSLGVVLDAAEVDRHARLVADRPRVVARSCCRRRSSCPRSRPEPRRRAPAQSTEDAYIRAVAQQMTAIMTRQRRQGRPGLRLGY
jgi:hypothetical protein